MVDDRNKLPDETSSAEGVLDLSVLQELDFGPDWGSKPSEAKPRRSSSRKAGFKEKKPSRRRGAGQPRVREKITKPSKPPEPQHLVNFVSEEAPFVNLIREMRTSCRTYSLFELAKIILAKPERFAVLATPIEKPGEESSGYFVTKPQGLPFVSHEEACRHLFTHQGDSFFEVEERDTEAPAGSFSAVTKCGITGTLLPPPNYHRYTELIHEHHASCLSNMPFEKFQRSLETEQNAEAVTAWLEGMKKISVYRLKDRSEDEPESFETREALQRFLFGQRFPKLIRKSRKARFSGSCIGKLFADALKRDVEQALEEQRRYPLSTANLLRSRFRRMNFAVYKHGAKGITLVCAAKRKLRTPETVFADSIQALLSFLEENPTSRKSDLIEKHLGFAQEKRSEEQEEIVRQLARDFRWLVTEGYLTELPDGTLFLPPMKSSSRSNAGKAKHKQNKSMPVKPLDEDSSIENEKIEKAAQLNESAEHSASTSED